MHRTIVLPKECTNRHKRLGASLAECAGRSITAGLDAKQRDDLRDVARGYLDDGVELLELEYQPKEG